MENNIYSAYFTSGKSIAGWNILRELPESSLGKIFLAFHATQVPKRPNCIAVKIIAKKIEMSSFWQDFFDNEYKTLIHIPPEIPIVRLFTKEMADFGEENQEFYYLATEYCPGGNLKSFLAQYPNQQLPPSHIFLLLEELVVALQYAHQKNLVHGALTPENIVLSDNGIWKISDFGLGKMTQKKPICIYAPECFLPNTMHPSRDIWSLGVVLYWLVTGKYPYLCENSEQYIQQTLNAENYHATLSWPNELANPSQDKMTTALVYLIQQMLQVQPKKRPTIENLKEAIERCKNWIIKEDRKNYFSVISHQIQQNDIRPQTQFLQKLSNEIDPSNIPLNKPRMKQERLKIDPKKPSTQIRIADQIASTYSTHNYKKIIWAIVLFLPLAGTMWYFQNHIIQTWEKFWKNVRTTQSPIIQLQAIAEYPNYAWIIQFPNFNNLILPSISSEVYPQSKWHLRFQNIPTDTREEQPPKTAEYSIPFTWEKIQQGKYHWEVPLDFPDGIVHITLQATLNETPLLQSEPLKLVIQESYTERQNFQKLQTIIQELENKAKDFTPIIQIYQQYLIQSPETYFKDRILENIKLYQDKASFHHYQKILSIEKQEPPALTEIIEECAKFLQQYPNHEKYKKIKSIFDYYTFWAGKRTYNITLNKGYIKNTLLNADCYVRVFVDSSLVWTSSVIKDNNHPNWNSNFSLSWQSGQTITIELWDKNIINDKKYHTNTASDPLAIQIFKNRIGTVDTWVDFNIILPEKNW